MPIESSVAVILAAGHGRRMGEPKALLQWKGEPLLFRVARGFLQAGVDEILAVISKEVLEALGEDFGKNLGEDSSEALGEATPMAIPGSLLPHPLLHTTLARANTPMMESVRLGLEWVRARHRRRIFLQPVDTGPPSKDIVRKLHRALKEASPALAAKPVYHGRGGHPLLLSGDSLNRLPWRHAQTLREALAVLLPVEIQRVEVEDPRVLRNWNRREDLAEEDLPEGGNAAP